MRVAYGARTLELNLAPSGLKARRRVPARAGERAGAGLGGRGDVRRTSGLKDVPPAHAALRDRAVGGGDLVERYDGVYPRRQVAARGGVEELGEPGTVGLGHHHADGDAALFCGRRARLHADEEAAVADQRDALLLEHGTVGYRVPAGCGLCSS